MEPSTSSDAPFERTVCACEGCRACCKRQPGSLRPGDYEAIVAFVERTQQMTHDDAVAFVRSRLCASPGALVKEMATGRTYRIGTITPRYRKGRCVFLDANERCEIHEAAPAGCAFFDTHMSQWTAMPRSQWLATMQEDATYQALRNTLPMAQHYKPFSY